MVEVLSRGAGLRLPAVVAVLAGLIVFVGILLRRVEGRVGFLWLSVLWFGLVVYSGYFYFTSDTQALTIFKVSLSAWLGPILAIVGLILAWNFWQRRRYPLAAKILSALAFFILLLAVVMSWIQRESLEGSFWGPAFLSGLPLFLRPGILALGLAFPLSAAAAVIALLTVKPSTKGKFRRFGIPLLLLAFLGTVLGAKLLARQGVELPLVGSWLRESVFGVTTVDPDIASLNLKIERGEKGGDKDKESYLQVAASASVPKGKGRESRLMVRNAEGRSWAGVWEDGLTLSRGDKPISQAKVSLEAARLGQSKHLYVLLHLPSLAQPTVKELVSSGIFRLARLLRGSDRLHVAGAGALQTLLPAEPKEWEAPLNKALTAGSVDWNQAIPAAMKKLSAESGLKQILVVAEGNALPPATNRGSWVEQARKNKIAMDFVVLGGAPGGEEGIYRAADISGLGFQMLSAASATFGQYVLQFPSLAPLPRILLSRDPKGAVALTGGKMAFTVQAQDPSLIQSLQLKVDEEKPIDLEKQLAQTLDLDRLKIKPGMHRFALLLTTSTGDVVGESFTAEYVARKPLKFAKPMDRDTLSGAINVLLAPGKIQGLETGVIDLLVDGTKLGSATASPYLIPLDTATLSEGEHTLQAVQTFVGGSTETAQIQVKVSQQVPPVKIVRPSMGEYLSNLAEIEAQIGGGLFEQVQKVEFFVDGEWVGESLQAPYRFLWANYAFPAGSYFVQARAILNSQATASDAVEVALGQGDLVIQADPTVSAAGTLFPENVEVLVDASARLKEPSGSAIKMDLAKFALSELIQGLPPNVRLLARTFGGGRGSSRQNCLGSALLKKPAAELSWLEAGGAAPLAYGLSQLAEDLKKAQGSRVALLITDGWDQCGEDPLAVAAALAKQKLRLHIIYFAGVDPATESLLKKLAEVMGGRVYRVSREEELAKALRDAIQVSFSLYDYKNSLVLSRPLSREAWVVRSGNYRLEIDTSPILAQEKFVIPTGSRKVFTVLSQDGKYQLKEE
jgi:hypothetical protein